MEFVHVVDNVIPTDVCNSVIEKFKTDIHKHQGKLGTGHLNLNIKKCTDLHILKREDWTDITNLLSTYLALGLNKYFKHIENNIFKDVKLQVLEQVFGDNISCTGFQVQKYGEGDHFYWHTDDAYDSKRLLAFIMYLNTVDIENGGATEFLNSKIIHPKEGSILFFPSTWSYIHRGNVVKCGEKYIVTGFIQSNLKLCEDLST